MTKRMKTSETSEEATMQKMTAKERAKVHRERKKKYIQDLEEENRKLNLKVKELSEELNTLKQKYEHEGSVRSYKEKKSETTSITYTQVDSSYPQVNKFLKLKNEEEFKYKGLPKMLKENPDMVKYSMIQQSRELVGVNGKYRVSFIKDQFKNILDNVVNLEARSAIVMYSKIPVSKWARIAGATPQKFNQKSRTGDKDFDEVVETEISEDLINFVKTHGKKYFKNYDNIKR